MVAGSASREGRNTAGCSSCLPFCFWGSRVPAAPERRRRRRRRFKLKLSLSWFSWPWFRKRRGGANSEAGSKNKGKSRRKLLLLLLRSLQAKKELTSVSSGSSFLAKLQVSSFGVAKKRNRSKPRQLVDDDAAPTTSCAEETALARPETISQRWTRPADGVWRAPSSRFQSLQLDRRRAESFPGGVMWTAATTLGVIVFLGRLTAVFFLCSIMYGARWWHGVVRSETRSSTPSGGSSRSLANGVALDYLLTEEHKKKMAMYRLLDKAGDKRTSSRFCTIY